MVSKTLRAMVMGLAIAFVGCAEPSLEQLPADDNGAAVDEVQSVSYREFVGAWDVTEGNLKGIVFTETQQSANSRRYFADQVVQCFRAPCPAIRIDGAYRTTARYLYLTINGEAKRFSWTLRGDEMTLREGQTVRYRLRRAASYCARVSDCGEQSLITPRCVGAFTCSTENRCVYRCNTAETNCNSNADCSADTFCAASTCGGQGTCQRRPQACTALYQPVCGCDGRTYSNACAAANQGARVASNGECAPAPRSCRTNAECGPASMCASSTCGGVGVCRQITVRCSSVSMPVCGCDGETYNNECMAFTAGQNVAHAGACR